MAKKSPASSAKKKTTSSAKTPTKKTLTKKVPTKKAATKKVAAKKTSTKKPAVKKSTKASAKTATVAKKATTAKKPTLKKSVKKPVVKKTPTKTKAAAKPAKKTAAKPAPTKKASSAKTAAAKKPAAKNTAVKKVAAKKGATKVEKPTVAAKKAAKKGAAKAPAPAAKPAPAKAAPKPKGRNSLRSRILAKGKVGKSISFSLDEVKAIAKTTKTKKAATAAKKVEKKIDKTAEIEAKLAAAKPAHVAAASLADILGFNPNAGAKTTYNDPKKIPEKFRRYYKLLIGLRTHLTGQIDTHSEETLKRSSKDDAGDLSSYGQHMADAGTDTFDRDFALSLVSNEQEALAEIEAAINRIHKGTYGICEVTGKPIDKERLLAVPFTRNSAEAQKGLERNRHHVRTPAGLVIDGDDSTPLRDPNAEDE